MVRKLFLKKTLKTIAFIMKRQKTAVYGLTTDVLRDILRQNSEGISTIFQVFSQIKKTSSSQGHSYRPRNSACLYSLFPQPCPFWVTFSITTLLMIRKGDDGQSNVVHGCSPRLLLMALSIPVLLGASHLTLFPIPALLVFSVDKWLFS